MKETNNNSKELTANWEYNLDGFYLYCKNCRYEPTAAEVRTDKIDYCPRCKAKMLNSDRYKIK